MSLIARVVNIPFLFCFLGGVRLSSVVVPPVQLIPYSPPWPRIPDHTDRHRGRREFVTAVANAQRIAQRNTIGCRRR